MRKLSIMTEFLSPRARDIAASAWRVCFPVQSTTIDRRAQRPDTEIGSSRCGRCGSFSIEFCSRLSWISIRAAADAQASQDARLLTEAADHRQAELTCLRALAIRVELSLLTRRIYVGCGNMKDARANNFQPLSCFCQTCKTPILVLVALPSSSLSDTHR